MNLLTENDVFLYVLKGQVVACGNLGEDCMRRFVRPELTIGWHNHLGVRTRVVSQAASLVPADRVR